MIAIRNFVCRFRVERYINQVTWTRTGQVRHAGHAKWQNIKNTKQANDLLKCRTISRYVQLVRRAIVTNKMQVDPKLNSRLAAVLAEASKANVPKATLERAIERAQNIKMRIVNLEVQGPKGCTIIVRCETDNVPTLRRDVKKVLKKYSSDLMPDDTLVNMFKSQGFIRAAIRTLDGREINEDYAEEAAILSNATEVLREEGFPDPESGEPRDVWVFCTDAESLNPCKGELEKQGLHVLSVELELVPYRLIKLDNATVEQVQDLEMSLKELEQVQEVFHNVEQLS